MTLNGRKIFVLIAATFLAVAAGDQPGRYQLRVRGLACAVGPCATTTIVDRVTGEVTYGDTMLDLAASDTLDNVQISGPDWDLLVDGIIYQDASTHNVPVLRITKIVGRVATR